MRKRRLTALMLMCTFWIGSTAEAQTDSPSRERARVLFERGLELVDEERWEDAIEAFNESLSTYPTRSALYNRALCFGLSGRPAEAIRDLEGHRRRYGSDTDEEERAQIEAELARLTLRVGRIEVQVQGVDSAEVLLDGEEAGQIPLARPLMVNAGPHEVTVRGSDITPMTRQITVGAGDAAMVVLAVERLGEDRGTIRLSTDVDGAEVRLDGTLVGRTPIDTPIAASSGPHVLLVEAEGYEPMRSEVEVELREETLLELSLASGRSVEVSDAEDSGPTDDVGGGDGRGLLIGGYVSAGVAVAALGTALGLFLWNNSQFESWDSENGRIAEAISGQEPISSADLATWTADNDSLHERIRAVDAATWAMFAIGSAAAVATTVLLVLGLRQRRRTTSSAMIFVPTSQGVSLAGRF